LALPKNCPLCFAGHEKQAVITRHVYGGGIELSRAFFHCEACDISYLYPGLTSEEEARFYAAEFENFMAGRSGNEAGWHKAEEHQIANKPTFERRMKYLRSNLSKKSSLLEVGCSSGFMLFPLKESGHDCKGIEPSGAFSHFLKSRGLASYDSLRQLQELAPEAKFDLILHFFVLEHIASPLDFLKTQLSLLNSGGKIIFEIPNSADPLHTIYDIPAFERFYWSIAHPWYFSESSLHYLLKQLGQPYEILRDQRYDLSNHLIWARDGLPGGMGRFTNLLGLELEESYKQTLIRSGKCDTLVGIITKK
jgi:2-polyprenyl-3-methyl-5-hydroxy-6-metoxy-1,4-benzoquinol methylase